MKHGKTQHAMNEFVRHMVPGRTGLVCCYSKAHVESAKRAILAAVPQAYEIDGYLVVNGGLVNFEVMGTKEGKRSVREIFDDPFED